MQILSLFSVMAHLWLWFAEFGHADFVTICVVPALFGFVWVSRECRFCRYLRSSRSVCACLDWPRMRFLSLFV